MKFTIAFASNETNVHGVTLFSAMLATTVSISAEVSGRTESAQRPCGTNKSDQEEKEEEEQVDHDQHIEKLRQ